MSSKRDIAKIILLCLFDLEDDGLITNWKLGNDYVSYNNGKEDVELNFNEFIKRIC